MTSANVQLKQFSWPNRQCAAVPVTVRVALDDPALDLKLEWARSVWLAIDDLTAQEAVDLADRWCPVARLVEVAAAYARAGERVTTTLTWHRMSDESPYDVTVTVPASWAWPDRHEQAGPWVLAEAFYDWFGVDLVTPQECCDYLSVPGQAGMRRIKQLVAWRRAQLRRQGTFDWADHSSAFAVQP